MLSPYENDPLTFSSTIALVDANNFFVSCERIFNPKLNNKPVIVLSNNDGCAIARSNEAKALGIAMGAPLHTIREIVKKHNVQVFSANFELYGDMSQRIMTILKKHIPSVEVYSIDEAFLDLSMLGIHDFNNFAIDLHQMILQQTGIPITIGISFSKTLAKIASYHAKKNIKSHACMLTHFDIMQGLKKTPVDEIWGVGRALAPQLKAKGYYTALDLANLDPRYARKLLTVTGERLVRELQGIACLSINPEEPQRQGIQVTRSFGKRLTEFDDIAEAISTYATLLGEQLRDQKLKTSSIHVFCRTSPFASTPYYKGIASFDFEKPTNDTTTLIKGAIIALKKAFKPNLIYQKAGIYAAPLVHDTQPIQKSLFATPKIFSEQPESSLAHTIDKINHRFGKDCVKWASSGINPKFAMRQEHKSPRYTTRFNELAIVHAN